MVLRNELIYFPKIREITKEEQVKELLNDVRRDLQLIGLPDERAPEEILEIIEQGKYGVPLKQSDAPFYHSVNLSKATALILGYRRKSKRGCESCKEMNVFRPLPDETLKYCKLYESEEMAALNGLIMSGFSPMIKSHYVQGCEDRKPIFSKTIEELLK